MPICFGNVLLISIQILWRNWTLLGRGSWQNTLPQVRTICDCICCNFLFFWMRALNLWGTESHCKLFRSVQQRFLLRYLFPLNFPIRAGCWNAVVREMYPINALWLYTYISSEIKISEKVYIVLLHGASFTMSQCRSTISFKEEQQ